MVFSSMNFLWIFLPIVFVMSRIAYKTKYQNIWLLLASLFFYAWGEPRYVLILLGSILMNWVFGLLIDRYRAQAKWLLAIDIIGNLGILGYYKYTNFFLNTLRHIVPGANIPMTSIALPIGISFFTFQAMSYVIDLYRGKYKVQKNILNLALYVSFFPQLIAGPIVMYKDIDAQIMNRKITREKTAIGFRRFIYGLGKKVILANLIAVAADNLYGLQPDQLTSPLAWLCAITYSLQIYYDFSGYSDMAIGLGHMFGFTFLENFNLPYVSASIKEFWRRWHISLSTWFRDYLYIPLGGNRKGKTRTYINLFIVFAMTGLWHGASWNFVGWGLFHGMFLIIERMGFGKVLDKSKVLSRVYTLLVVMIGWIFFRVEAVGHGLAIIKRMFLFWQYQTGPVSIGMEVSVLSAIAIVLGILGSGILQSLAKAKPFAGLSSKWSGSAAEAVYLTIVLLYSILLLANNTYNPFIYFRF